MRSLSDVQLEKRIGKEKTVELTEEVEAFLVYGGCDKMKNQEKQAVMEQALRCLASYIRDVMQLPVTIKTIVDAMSLLSHAVDMSFPGYAQSGLLSYVIRSVA